MQYYFYNENKQRGTFDFLLSFIISPMSIPGM